MSLSALGWDEQWAARFAALDRDDVLPARVTRQDRGRFRVTTETGDELAWLPGRWRAGDEDVPVIGDWVAVSRRDGGKKLRIEALLDRRNRLAREAPGRRTEIQVLAANVETLVIVSGLDGDFNPRRLERFLDLAAECRCRPILVLNKLDLAEDAAAAVAEVERLAAEVPILRTSAETGDGVAELFALLKPGETVAFLGSSGVGKSSLVNRMLEDERQATSAVREGDDRGRHTTTVRELFALPNGTLVIDSPGIREVAAWRDGPEVDQMGSGAFDDIEALAEQCRFRDCRHEGEPGCAVEAAVADGRLDGKRLIHYRKLRDEREEQGERQAKAEKIAVKRRRKASARPRRPLDDLDEDDLL